MIPNGSPRAPKSNSKQYAEVFAAHCGAATDYFNISRNNHLPLSHRMSEYTDVLLVFPLCADSLPVGFLDFLKSLEAHPPGKKPVISVLINCRFLESGQNDVAVKMLRFFAQLNGYRMGSVLKRGSYPGYSLQICGRQGDKKLARSLDNGQYRQIEATMP